MTDKFEKLRQFFSERAIAIVRANNPNSLSLLQSSIAAAAGLGIAIGLSVAVSNGPAHKGVDTITPTATIGSVAEFATNSISLPLYVMLSKQVDAQKAASTSASVGWVNPSERFMQLAQVIAASNVDSIEKARDQLAQLIEFSKTCHSHGGTYCNITQSIGDLGVEADFQTGTFKLYVADADTGDMVHVLTESKAGFKVENLEEILEAIEYYKWMKRGALENKDIDTMTANIMSLGNL